MQSVGKQTCARCHRPVYDRCIGEWNRLRNRCEGYKTVRQRTHCGAKIQSLAQHSCPVLCQMYCVKACLQNPSLVTRERSGQSPGGATQVHGEPSKEEAKSVTPQASASNKDVMTGRRVLAEVVNEIA